jgi:hypothetical protein
VLIGIGPIGKLGNKVAVIRGIISEVRCGFFWIYVPTSYSVVFLLPVLVPIKINFVAVRHMCGLVIWAGLIWIGLGQSKCQF